MTAALDALPKYYTYRDLLALYGDEATFIEAWVAGTIPLDVKRACTETMDPLWFQSLLLQRLSRQLAAQAAQLDRLIAVVSEPVGGGYLVAPPEPPER